jgi:glycosyltransferase involved in cell wall biosynthesis
MKYKILYLTYHPEIGGGETILLSLLGKLDEKLFEPVVVIAQKGSLLKKLKELNVPTFFLPLSGYCLRTFFVPGMSPLGIVRFLRLCQNLKPDIIHLNHLNLAFYAGIAGKILRVPVIATAHGPWDSYYFYQDIATALFSDKILANTPLVYNDLLKRNIIPPKKIKTILFGIDTKLFSPKNKDSAKPGRGLPLESLVVTWVGRFDPEKDPITFLKAAFLVNKKYPKTLFLIVGSAKGDFSRNRGRGLNQTIRKYLTQNLHFSKKIILKGFIDNEEMPRVLAATDIFVSSSISESFGLALAEAQSSGVPVVSTNKGGQYLIVKDAETGFLVPPKNPKKLAGRIIKLIKNEHLRKDFGQKGRVNIEKNLNIETYVKNIEEIYLDMISKAP